MTREILFKAVSLDGKWVDGLLCKYKQYGSNLFTPCIQVISEWDSGDYLYHIEVHPDTVCQFTGVLDKDGKKIFDGDIVVVPDEYPFFSNGEPNYVGIVEFVYSQWQYVLHCVDGKRSGISEGINSGLNDTGYEDGECSCFKITGNIHDDKLK